MLRTSSFLQALLLSVGLAAISAPNVALADDTAAAPAMQAATSAIEPGRAIQLRPSFRYTQGMQNEVRAHGFGVDLELRIFPSRSPWRYGAFISGDLMLDATQRYAAGLVGGYGMFGIEVGVAQRTASDRFAASTGLHLAKTFTLGPVGIAFRMTIPLASQMAGQEDREIRGFERAFRVSLGWSFGVSGQRPTHSSFCGPGGHGGHGHGHH